MNFVSDTSTKAESGLLSHVDQLFRATENNR